MIVTPHLGASTAEATDRAGYQAAEQVVAALTGGVVTSAVNVPAVASEDMEVLGPFLGLATSLGRLGVALAAGTSVEGIEVEYLGRIAERDTRFLTVQVLKGALAGHTEEQVNDVNAPGLAEERGISVAETKQTHARDFSDLVRVTVASGGGERTRVVGTVLGRRDRPHLLEAWGSRFNVQLEDHLAIFRYEDRPGMLGRIGTAFGERGREHQVGRRRAGRQDGRRPGGDAGGLRRGAAGAGRRAGGQRRVRCGPGGKPLSSHTMRVRTTLARAVLVVLGLSVAPAVALAVKPEPGQFNGSIAHSPVRGHEQ